MKITATNYAAHKPDRSTLTEAEQAGYDLVEMGGLEVYGQDADITEAIDLYLAELNRKYMADFKAGKVMLPEQEPAPAAKHSKRKTVAQRKQAPAATPAQRAKAGPARFKLTGDAGAEQLSLECDTLTRYKPEGGDETECVVRARCNGEWLYFFIDAAPDSEPDADGYYPSAVVAVAAEGDDLHNPHQVGFNKLADKRSKLYGAQVLDFYRKAWNTREKNEKLTTGRAQHNRQVNSNKKAAQELSRRNTPPAPAAKPAGVHRLVSHTLPGEMNTTGSSAVCRSTRASAQSGILNSRRSTSSVRAVGLRRRWISSLANISANRSSTAVSKLNWRRASG